MTPTNLTSFRPPPPRPPNGQKKITEKQASILVFNIIEDEIIYYFYQDILEKLKNTNMPPSCATFTYTLYIMHNYWQLLSIITRIITWAVLYLLTYS